ncbi:MAG: hypothetical protein ABIF10_02195 [Candidatus Woesearchaeota archaeon]
MMIPQSEKMNKKAVILLLVLLVAGCTSTRNRTSGGEENYRTGTQGLYMNFVPYSPPDRLFDDENLRVRIELFNRGAEDLAGSNNRLYLSGFDTSIITGIPTSGMQIPDIEGKKMYSPEGGFDNIEFSGYVRSLKEKNINVYQPVILLTACYKYSTIADPSVCIDSDPFGVTTQQRVCNWNSVVSTGSQGAPIAVTSVQVEPQPGKSRFKIYVQNVGGGDVLKDGADILNRCNPYDATGIDYKDIDYVHVDDVSIGENSIMASCKPLENGYLRLQTSGAGFMICEVDNLVGPAYTTPLRIKFSYNYRQTLTKQVRIIQSP